jgi:hypothetical protein
MASDNPIPKSRFYLYVTGHGASGLAPSTVFYDVDDEWLAKELCHLFDREYGGDRLSFQYKSSDSIPKVEQILLREALTELSAYGDPDQGIYDPAPPQQSFDRAQYAVRAQGWEQLLNPGTAVTGDADAGRADQEPELAKPKKTPKVNDRMIAEMASDLEAVKGYTAKQWAHRLGCGETTVKETLTWKSLSLLRQQAKVEKRKDRHGRGT